MVENRYMTHPSALGETERECAPSKPLTRADIESLIATEYIGLRLLIARRAGDEEVAADLLNDAICTTWEKWQAGQIEHPEQIAGFIFQVAMNHLRNHRRMTSERADKRAPQGALDELESPEHFDRDAIENHLAARVKALIQSMNSSRDRTVLVRFYLDEADRETICRDLNLTGAQFARILHRARERLRSLVEATGLKRSDLFSLLGIL
jgi:RNA polymerase sigma-70 factor (ECF subfamily)